MTPHNVIPVHADESHIRFSTVTAEGITLSGGSLSFRTVHFAGRAITCGLVGGVGTDPEYRRGGLVREIFSEMAKACDDRAIPLTILHPFSFAYYRKFGFERVADHRVLEFPITALDFAPRYPALVRCQGDTYGEDLATVYNTFAAEGRHLLPKRSRHSFPTSDSTKKVYLSRDEEGRPDGYIILEIENYFSVNRMVSVNLHVHELVFLTPEALIKLFGFIRMFEGEMETVKLHNTAMAPEIELCLRHYMHIGITIIPDIMARINDVKAFFEAVSYPAEPGSFTFKAKEPATSPWTGDRTNGTWRVDYGDSKATVTSLPDGADWDFAADISALTQLAFGYESYGYDTARYTANTEWRTEAKDFFRAFPHRPAGIFEHF
jgi:predicted acetyltransferase